MLCACGIETSGYVHTWVKKQLIQECECLFSFWVKREREQVGRGSYCMRPLHCWQTTRVGGKEPMRKPRYQATKGFLFFSNTIISMCVSVCNRVNIM